MLDGLRPETCVIVVDNIRWDRLGTTAAAFDLYQYGCDGDRRVLLDKQRIEGSPGQQGVYAEYLDQIERDVNRRLRERRGCTCR
jgi:hypothetical protein